jgi:tetratricopeptide (TPR) repeat protein
MINAGLQLIPDESALYISRGILYAQLAQYDKAEADFKRVEQLDSAQSISSYAGDLTEVMKNNPDRALAKVRTQLQAHPENPLLNYLLAQLLMNQAPAVGSEAFKEALKSALLTVKLKPDHVGSRDLLASVYMRTGQYDLAIEQCKIALKYSPSDESAMYHLIISMRHTGHTDDLKPLVDRLAELHQESLRHETERKQYRLLWSQHQQSRGSAVAPFPCEHPNAEFLNTAIYISQSIGTFASETPSSFADVWLGARSTPSTQLKAWI